MSRTQLLEVEARLKSSLAALQERSLQYKELTDSHQRLRYQPCSPPPLEPLYFWEIEPLLGSGGHTGGHGFGHCCPSQLWLPRRVEEDVGKPGRPHLGGSCLNLWGLYHSWVMVGGRRGKCPHPTLRRGNAAPTEAAAIAQGRADCPRPGAGEHQGRAPRLAAQEGQSLLVLHGHRREQDAAAGARRLPQGCSARGGRSPALRTRTRGWPRGGGWVSDTCGSPQHGFETVRPLLAGAVQSCHKPHSSAVPLLSEG